MKLVQLTLFYICLCAPILRASDLESKTITEREATDVRQKLQEFEKGNISLDEASGISMPDGGSKIVVYYLLHTNDVSIKMKLPISRCFAMQGDYTEAAKLAQEYINVYSNDWHGWKVVAAAKLMMQSYGEAVSAYTNAIRLGDEEDYVGLGGAAWAADRLDILRDMVVPRLLIFKDDSKRFSERQRLDMRKILIVYSLRSDKRDIFIKALDGVKVEDILSRSDLKNVVASGCERFKAKETEKICRSLAAAAESSLSSSNTNSPSP